MNNKFICLLLALICFAIVGCEDNQIIYDSDGCREGFYIDVNKMCTKIARIEPISVVNECLGSDIFDGKMCQPDNSKTNVYTCKSGYYLINYNTCAKNGTVWDFSKCSINQTYSSANKKCYATYIGNYASYRSPYYPTKMVTCPQNTEKMGDSCIKIITEKPVK